MYANIGLLRDGELTVLAVV